jgi:hypothetical protein
MSSLKNTIGALIMGAAGLAGITGCQTAEAVKPVEQPLPSRIVDIDKDGKPERVYVEKIYNLASKEYEYELRVEGTDKDGRKRMEVIRNYGTMDPRTLNYLTCFYSGNPEHLNLVIDGKIR